MFNRLLLLVAIILFTINPVLAKEKGYYLPTIGYTSISEKELLKNRLDALQLGIIGYAFSNDFRLELTGLGCFEEFKILSERVIKDNVSSHTPPCTPPQSPKLPAHDATPLKPISPYHESELKESELKYNPWKSPTSSQLGTTHSRTTFAPNATTSHQDSHTTSAPDPLKPAPPSTKDASTQTDNPQEKEMEIHSSTVKWTGAMLAWKCTLLHLHPQCRIYWAPGIMLLYPHHPDLNPAIRYVLKLGMHWALSEKWSIDLSGTTPLGTWKSISKMNSLFYRDTFKTIQLTLNWHF